MLRTVAPSLLFGLVLLLTGCAPNSEQERAVHGRVSVDCESTAPILVSFGTRWVPPHTAPHVVVDSDGSFALPPDIEAANAFVDINENGVLDRFVEPTDPCVREAGDWHCRLNYQRVVVHRSTTRYVGNLSGDPGEEIQESMQLSAEVYDDNCRPVPDATLCTADGARCSEALVPPFRGASAPVQMIASCGEEDIGPMDLKLRTRSTSTHVTATRPPALSVTAALDKSTKTARLVVDTSAEVSRVVVWAGPVSTRDRSVGADLWTSEDEGFEVRGQGTHHEIDIPDHAVRACAREPDCVLLVQALRHEWIDDTTLVLSEGRLVGVTP